MRGPVGACPSSSSVRRASTVRGIDCASSKGPTQTPSNTYRVGPILRATAFRKPVHLHHRPVAARAASWRKRDGRKRGRFWRSIRPTVSMSLPCHFLRERAEVLSSTSYRSSRGS
eukprot:3835274-Rhodomonas_salina.1